MLHFVAQINIWAVIVASIVGFIFAGVYFGVLTPKYYAFALGREKQPAMAPSMLFILGPFICNTIMIVTTALLMQMLPGKSFNDALALGAMIGMGYLWPMCMTIAINPNFPRPFWYMLVNAPYFLVSIFMTCSILHFMQ